MLEDVVPPTACWAVASVARAGLEDELFGAEREAIAAAAPIRIREFAAGRTAARRALARLGVARVALPVGPSRAPLWPPGIVGSITHCDRLAAAAVARVADLAALGIDAEPARPLEPDVLEVVATVAERGRLVGPLSGTVLFSAKEAFYKCWSAAGGPMLDFDDVDVVLEEVCADDPIGCLAARPVSDRVDGGTIGSWTGRWAVRDGFVLTAVWLPGAGG